MLTVQQPLQVYNRRRSNSKRVIVFVENPDRPGPFGAQPGTLGDEFAWRRTNVAPYPGKEILEAVKVPLKDAGLEPLSVRYDRKAGCACGCSPGYVVKTAEYYGGVKALWLTEIT